METKNQPQAINAFFKVQKIIHSCMTKKQLYIANKCILQFSHLYGGIYIYRLGLKTKRYYYMNLMYVKKLDKLYWLKYQEIKSVSISKNI